MSSGGGYPRRARCNAYICIESTRESNGKISRERRFFISSLEADPVRLLGNIRSHWAIEASHWTLDVTFNEDSSRARIKNAQANLAILRKIARNILHSDNTQKISTRMKRWASMDPQFLMEMLSKATV
jgi:predicted transposase YbfD/YdcC